MTSIPANQKIYHITHVDNLPQIVGPGVVWSDAKRIELGLDCTVVGMSTIKRRRLEELEVGCHPGTKVGQYVPFYFCPRSIMLYILYRGNHPEITYRGGQHPIVHLQADLQATVQWASRQGVRWAFSDRNAGARVARFFNRLDDLDTINWSAVAATDFRDMVVKEYKQAEFLVWESLPWTLIEHVGVHSQGEVDSVNAALARAKHRPTVRVERAWYY